VGGQTGRPGSGGHRLQEVGRQRFRGSRVSVDKVQGVFCRREGIRGNVG
jgi:hypothetical protein